MGPNPPGQQNVPPPHFNQQGVPPRGPWPNAGKPPGQPW